MAICKYFQQGCCRFGQNCRFEHVYPSKYTYQAGNSHGHQQPTNTITDEQLVATVQADINTALNGNQWILSCYSPHKEKPVFPGISDLSPEEARLFFYEANANNNIPEAVNYMNSLVQEARSKYEQLLQPGPHIIKVLRSLYKGEPVTSPFSSYQTPSSNSASSIFRSAAQNNSVFGQASTSTGSIFGQSNVNPSSVFGQSTSNAGSVFGQTNNTSVFHQTNTYTSQNDAAKSIFAQASQNAFSTNQANVFGQTSTNTNQAAKSLFAQATQNTFGNNQTQQPTQNVFQTNQSSNQNVFGNNASQNVFGQNVFASNQPNSQNPFLQNTSTCTSSPFSTSTSGSVFGGNVFDQPTDESGVYSKMEDVSEEDLAVFKSDNFTLGFIPEIAPPKLLCH